MVTFEFVTIFICRLAAVELPFAWAANCPESADVREWTLVFIPVTIIVYFIVYPDQFSELVAWALQWVR